MSALTLIYALRDGRWIKYVGKTCKALEWRLSSHLTAARRGDASHRGRGIRKMLQEGRLPTITLIQVVNGGGNKEEIAWIAYFRSYGIKLWNEADGGQGGSAHRGHHHSIEARRKIGLAGKNRIVSLETRKRLRIAKLGKRKSLETRDRMSAAQKGRKVSLQTCQRISESKRGVPWSLNKRLSFLRSKT